MSNEVMNKIVWMDMEFTGLNPSKDQILQLACVITDWQLQILAEFPNHTLHAEIGTLEQMDEWNRQQQQASGLWTDALNSSLTIPELENKLSNFLQTQIGTQGLILAGNSIHFDRQYLKRYLPKVETFFHYRLLDVTTVKLLALKWFPEVEEFVKNETHTALEDIKESIAELRYYQNLIFKLNK